MVSKKTGKSCFDSKIFQNIRLRIGAGKVVKSAEWGRVGKKQAIRNLSDIYTDNSPVNVRKTIRNIFSIGKMKMMWKVI